MSAPHQRFAEHDAAAGALRAMEAAASCAERVFGSEEALAWLAPAWTSLAHAAAELPYRADEQQVHAAPMLLRARDWAAAEARVAAIESWRRIPVPLAWMAEARFGHGGLEAAWCLLVELAWIDAPAFGALARRLDAPPLRKLLEDFDAGFAGGDAETAWFPAWALIVAPSLASVFRQAQACRDTAPERGARLVMELLALERQGRHAEVVAHRKRLRDLHAGLFSLYMSTR
jgi:hypothetical protein